jgi:hypothetical protein
MRYDPTDEPLCFSVIACLAAILSERNLPGISENSPNDRFPTLF